ncbi:sugar ABC transporter permease [Acidipropionibacterium acidipropionici]|jgi:multiple sugar transport system permease protein|uniref:ABC transporter permease n=1 Tax=Acidipropionibacterium acidipropionici TaxID=1748 RepID=A0AAC8YFG8_9ACTN|nr:sugar ABC transporter permease [Acidipropionibacterium acidipropionici]AMS05479.1 ABC transporter permease [Acidipropionibacterium acidipropionici]AOZ46951.1 ABC transporter permease [Acidipropionibacterium acidipropionici]AZP36956.1 sugar ABC transporter permease [Acidipropionibacterium acidipropionici]
MAITTTTAPTGSTPGGPSGGGRSAPRRASRQPYWWFPYLIVAPAVIFEIAIHIIPMLTGVWMSFVKLTKFFIRNWANAPFIGLGNYQYAIDINTSVGQSLVRSFLMTCAYTIIVVGASWILGMAAAVALQKTFRSRAFWRTLFLIPYALPMYAGIITWNFMFQRDTGMVNHLLVDQLHLMSSRPFLLIGGNAFGSLVTVAIWRMWPFAFLMIMAGLQSVPTDIYEASAIDGATPWRQWRTITLPMLGSVNKVLVLVMFLWVFNDFNTPYVLFGNGQPPAGDLISFHIYNASFLSWDFGTGAAMSVMLLIFLLIVSLIYLFFINRSGDDNA